MPARSGAFGWEPKSAALVPRPQPEEIEMTRNQPDDRRALRRTLAAALVPAIASAFLLSVGAVSAIAADNVPAQLIEAAKKEGEVALYTAESESQLAEVNKAFEAKYGIKVVTTRLASGALTTRYAGERQGGIVVADTVVVSNLPLFTDNPTWWQPLDENAVPGLNAFPKEKRGDRYATMSHNVFGLAWNTNLVKGSNEPKSYLDLVNNPLFAPKGSIAYADPRASLSAMHLFKLLVDKYGEDFFKKLMDRGVVIAAGSSPGAQQVAAGASMVLIGAFANTTQAVIEAGGPVKFAQVLSPLTGVDNYIGLSTNPKHPNAARLYASFRISKEGQEAMCRAKGASSPLGDFAGCEPAADASSYIPTDWNVYQDKVWQAKYLPLLGLKPL